MTSAGIKLILTRAKVKIRPRPKPGELTKARDNRIVALYKKGLSSYDVGKKVGHSGSMVLKVLARRGIPLRAAAEYPKPNAQARAARLRALVSNVAHLYDTGPGTSAVQLAEKLGVCTATVAKNLKALGIKTRSAAGRAPPMDEEKVKAVKAAIVRRKESYQEIGKKYGLTASAIASIAHGHSWKTVPWPGGKPGPARIPKNKLSPEDVHAIRFAGCKTRTPLSEIAREYSMSIGAITGILLRKTWTTLPWPKGMRYKGRSPLFGTKRGKVARKLNIERATALKADLIAEELSFRELGVRYNIHEGVVAAVAMGRLWKKAPWPKGKRYIRRGPGRRPKGQADAGIHAGVLRIAGSRSDSRGGETWERERG
jgi:hypothetical protein